MGMDEHLLTMKQSERIMLMPPGVVALLVMFSRNHNTIARDLLSINEEGKYADWNSLKDEGEGHGTKKWYVVRTLRMLQLCSTEAAISTRSHQRTECGQANDCPDLGKTRTSFSLLEISTWAFLLLLCSKTT